MNYNQYEVSDRLQPFVKCYWSLEAPVATIEEKQRIVPDGCIEMIFHYGDLYKQYFIDGTYCVQPRCFVYGQITSPLEIAATGFTGIFSARFHPDGFSLFTSYALLELENKATPLSTLFGPSEIGEHAILNAHSNEERVRIIETYLLNLLDTRIVKDRIAKSCVHLLLSHNGNKSINEMANELNIHRRQLERKFSENIGLSPKQYAKVIRLQSALRMLWNDQDTALTDLALENGYYDQSHFIKDFKEITGVRPKDFYKGHLKMSTLFATKE